MDGWEDVTDEDKDLVKKLIKDHASASKDGSAKKAAKTPAKAKAASITPKKTPAKKDTTEDSPKKSSSPSTSVKDEPKDESEDGVQDSQDLTRPAQGDPKHKDASFRQFRKLCASIAEEPSYTGKTQLVRDFFDKGAEGKGFKGDLYVWVRLLLPNVVKRIYNVQSKQLVKIFARIFGAVEEDMLEDLEAGDVAETVAKFFEESKKVRVKL